MAGLKKNSLKACLLFWVGIVLIQTGCSSSRLARNMELKDLQSSDPAVRIMAIKWAGENKALPAVPQLVVFLQNEDRAVRFYAIESLRRITGTDNGFDYKANPKNRAEAVGRWREFVKSNKQPARL